MKPAKYFVLLAAVPGLVAAQDCAEIEDDKARLACYDDRYTPAQAVPETTPDAKPAPASETAPVSAATPAKSPEPEEPATLPNAPAVSEAAATPSSTASDNFGLREKVEASNQSVVARIETIKTAGTDIYLYLDNGQVWREIGSSNRVRFREGREVTITEGAMGSFNLTMEGQNRLSKVKRIR
jgi:hypothetical protein